jgi:DNA polymerase III alpha subunit
MKQLFNDLPEAIANCSEIVEKIEIYNLAREVLLPKFEIPEEFEVLKTKPTAASAAKTNFCITSLTKVPNDVMSKSPTRFGNASILNC